MSKRVWFKILRQHYLLCLLVLGLGKDWRGFVIETMPLLILQFPFVFVWVWGKSKMVE